MTIRIEVKSANVGQHEIKPGNKPDSKQFEPFTKRTQTAYVHGMVDRNGTPEPFPQRIELDRGTTQEPKPAYSVGFYDIDPASFYVGRFDDLQLGRLILVPVVKAAPAA